MGKDLDKMIGLYLTILGHVSSKYEFIDDEITPQQVRMLEYINEVSNCSMSQICEFFNLSPSRATRVINKLVKNLFLQRQHSEEDRRKVILSITNHGSQKIIKRRELRFDILRKLFRNLTNDDINVQMRILKKLVIE
jgi:DNA-binding MarR family transcriptional regulator